ncbi:hypothetical protein MBLNU230_g2029t1 [Neophaeotheca triangularis]
MSVSLLDRHHRRPRQPKDLSYIHISLPQNPIHHVAHASTSSPLKSETTFIAELDDTDTSTSPLSADSSSPRPTSAPSFLQPTPRDEQNCHVRPPTAGGGPLSSHPTTPDDVAVEQEHMALPHSDKAPTTPPPPPTTTTDDSSSTSDDAHNQTTHQPPDMSTLASHHQNNERRRRDSNSNSSSFRIPTAPASATPTKSPQTATRATPSNGSPPQRRPSTGVRRLLSITNLRTSFAATRPESSQQNPSSDATQNQHPSQRPQSAQTTPRRPSFSWNSLTTSKPTNQTTPGAEPSRRPSLSWNSLTTSKATNQTTPSPEPSRRPSLSWTSLTTSKATTTATTNPNPTDSNPGPRPPLNPAQRTTSWLRRKSALWNKNGNKHELEAVDESHHERPESSTKRFRAEDNSGGQERQQQQQQSPQPPAPKLPELGRLGAKKGDVGSGLDGSGGIGWEEEMFRRGD